MKKILCTLLIAVFGFIGATNMDALTTKIDEIKELASLEIDGETVTDNIYVIGTHAFTNSITVEKIMIGSRTIPVGEENIIYFYNTVTGTWSNAVNGGAVALPESIDLQYFNLKPLATDTVYTEEELRNALANEDITTINLGEDIEGLTSRLVISRELTLNGKGSALTFTEGVNTATYGERQGLVVTGDDVTITNLKVTMDANEGDMTWTGTYGIQAYQSENVTLTNVTVTGADGGILVNDAEVTLTGGINVSGNEFGGIEVSEGDATLNATNITFTNTTEALARPTIWTDSEDVTVNAPELLEADIIEGQIQYYLEEENTTVNTEEDLRLALTTDKITTINLGSDLTGLTSRLVVNREVTINGNNHTLTFTEGVNAATYGERQGLIITSDNVTIKNLKVTMDANEGDKTWTGTYGIQAYQSENVTLTNVTVTGADGGILVNDAEVTLTGGIDVSGNEFGGIEVSEGSAALNATNATLVNTTEKLTEPTIWTDSEGVTVTGTGLTETDEIVDGQVQYYLDVENTKIDTEEELRIALNSKMNYITLADDIENIGEEIIIGRPLTLDGNGKTLSFAITEDGVGGLGLGGDTATVSSVMVKNLNIELPTTEEYLTTGIATLNLTNSIIRDVKVTNAGVAMAVVDSNISLEGTIDVTGSVYGVIAASNEGTTNVSAGTATFKNDTEDPDFGTMMVSTYNTTVTTNLYKYAFINDTEDPTNNIDLYYLDKDNYPEIDGYVYSEILVSEELEKPTTINPNGELTLSSIDNYSNVRFKIENIVKPENSNVKVWAQDTNGEIWDIIENGWGPATGFPVVSGYQATTEFEVVADTVGTYSADIVYYNVTTGEAINVVTIEFEVVE